MNPDELPHGNGYDGEDALSLFNSENDTPESRRLTEDDRAALLRPSKRDDGRVHLVRRLYKKSFPTVYRGSDGQLYRVSRR